METCMQEINSSERHQSSDPPNWPCWMLGATFIMKGSLLPVPALTSPVPYYQGTLQGKSLFKSRKNNLQILFHAIN